MTVELGTKEEILMLGMINNHVLWFAIGVLSTVSFYIIWKTIRIFLASHSIAKDTNKELEESKMSEPLDQQSLAYITDCKKSLILQVKINPDWVAPLLSEIPKLVQDIARTYYPNSKNPISAPDLSEFGYAIKLVSSDIADFLQSKPGRILNVSASTAHRTYRVARRLASDKWLKLINKGYKRLRPIVQMLRYKSPIMWTIVIGRNVAVRTLHGKIVNTIGMRAIQLYSGRLAMQLEEDIQKGKESD